MLKMTESKPKTNVKENELHTKQRFQSYMSMHKKFISSFDLSSKEHASSIREMIENVDISLRELETQYVREKNNVVHAMKNDLSKLVSITDALLKTRSLKKELTDIQRKVYVNESNRVLRERERYLEKKNELKALYDTLITNGQSVDANQVQEYIEKMQVMNTNHTHLHREQLVWNRETNAYSLLSTLPNVDDLTPFMKTADIQKAQTNTAKSLEKVKKKLKAAVRGGGGGGAQDDVVARTLSEKKHKAVLGKYLSHMKKRMVAVAAAAPSVKA